MAVRDMSDAQAGADWDMIRRVVAQLDQRISAQTAEAGMKAGEAALPEQAYAVLRVLLNAPDRRMPMTQLARRLTMTSGGFTKLADRLGRAGLIDRRAGEDDRRVVLAALTPEGVRIAKRVERGYHLAVHEHLLAVISPDQIRDAVQALKVLDDEPPVEAVDASDRASGGAPRRGADRSRPPRRSSAAPRG